MAVSEQFKKEVEALRLLNREWDSLSEDDQQAKHFKFISDLDAAVECGLVVFPPHSEESE